MKTFITHLKTIIPFKVFRLPYTLLEDSATVQNSSGSRDSECSSLFRAACFWIPKPSEKSPDIKSGEYGGWYILAIDFSSQKVMVGALYEQHRVNLLHFTLIQGIF